MLIVRVEWRLEVGSGGGDEEEAQDGDDKDEAEEFDPSEDGGLRHPRVEPRRYVASRKADAIVKRGGTRRGRVRGVRRDRDVRRWAGRRGVDESRQELRGAGLRCKVKVGVREAAFRFQASSVYCLASRGSCQHRYAPAPPLEKQTTSASGRRALRRSLCRFNVFGSGAGSWRNRRPQVSLCSCILTKKWRFGVPESYGSPMYILQRFTLD